MRAPSMVIGVGGIGADICARVARQLSENMPDKNSIQFAIMDTDINTIHELHREGFRGIEIQLSDNRTVKNCRESILDRLDDWYPQSDIFDRKSMTEGAGQQRSISRLAFDYSLRENKLDELFHALRELKEVALDASDQQIRIYIISSLAGGTGSGIILPLALCLNRYIQKTFGDNLALCKGFFVLSSAIKNNVKHKLEKQSLDSNAYATVKELDAFMRLADGDNARYQNLGIHIPDGESYEYQKYMDSSYEYCYLFGMINDEKNGLHSFEDLKNQVAMAVYLQACSPIHNRNNSREDNTLKFLIQRMIAKGSNKLSRFGSIGCGELVYPYDILRRYYAIRRAVTVMERQWQVYDEIYQKKDMEQYKRRKEGKKSVPVKRSTEYIAAVKYADKTDSFAEMIRVSCFRDEKDYAWDRYLDVLWDEAGKKIDEIRKMKETDESSDEYAVSTVMDILMGKSNRRSKIDARNRMLEYFRNMRSDVLTRSNELGTQLEHTLFSLHPLIEELSVNSMEYWLRQGENFLHPNAVRYFLYNLLDAIQVKMKKVEGEAQIEYSKLSFVDSDQKVNKGNYYAFYFLNLKKEWEKYDKAKEALYAYAKRKVYLQMLESCKSYAEKLCANYENFYDSLGTILDNFKDELSVLEERLNRTKGMGKAFICSDKECRDIVFGEIQRKSNFAMSSTGLSYLIFELMGKSEDEIYRKDALIERIKEYWIKDIEWEYPELNMNILHAMDMEYCCKNKLHMNEEMFKNQIRNAEKKLVAPYLLYKTISGEHQGISISCFNSELESEKDIYHDVFTWLKENDGIEDEFFCDKYRIMFYRSFVGLDAYEVLEYYHDGKEKSGEAFISYEKMIENMGNTKDGNMQITPHVDKKWNSILELPDPNFFYQNKKEIEIGCVFLFAILEGKFRKMDSGSYDFTLSDSGKKFENLMSCHEFLYENQWWEHLLLEQLEECLRKEDSEGKCVLLESIHNYDDGILSIIYNYNFEVPIPKQDSVRNTILINAAKYLLANCFKGEKSAIDRMCKEEMEYAADKVREKMDEDKVKGLKEMLVSFYRKNGYRWDKE